MNITQSTTLNELISGLGYLEKAEKRPTARALRETAGDPVAAADGCQVYANGYAVYMNGSGTTVLWLKDCLNFTYYFVQPKDGEKEGITGKSVLDEGALGAQPWYFGVMLRGDHQVEENMMNRKGDRRGQRADMKYDCDEAEMQEDEEDTYLHNLYSWRDTPFAENPEDAYIRKETQQEMLEKLSDTQAQKDRRERIYVCSPLRPTASDPEQAEKELAGNLEHAKDACRMITNLGGIPVCSHLFFTQFLKDDDPEERRTGRNLGLELLKDCDELWCFSSKISEGMLEEISLAARLGILINPVNHFTEVFYHVKPEEFQPDQGGHT